MSKICLFFNTQIRSPSFHYVNICMHSHLFPAGVGRENGKPKLNKKMEFVLYRKKNNTFI